MSTNPDGRLSGFNKNQCSTARVTGLYRARRSVASSVPVLVVKTTRSIWLAWKASTPMGVGSLMTWNGTASHRQIAVSALTSAASGSVDCARAGSASVTKAITQATSDLKFGINLLRLEATDT